MKDGGRKEGREESRLVGGKKRRGAGRKGKGRRRGDTGKKQERGEGGKKRRG